MLYRFAINHGGILLILTNFDNEKYVEFPLSSWLNHVKPSCLHPGCLTLYNAVPAWSFESFSMHIKISVTDVSCVAPFTDALRSSINTWDVITVPSSRMCLQRWPNCAVRRSRCHMLSPCHYCGKSFQRSHMCPVWIEIAVLLINLAPLEGEPVDVPAAVLFCEVCRLSFPDLPSMPRPSQHATAPVRGPQTWAQQSAVAA